MSVEFHHPPKCAFAPSSHGSVCRFCGRMEAEPLDRGCICDGHYDGCEHGSPCGMEALNSRGVPMCDECLPRRVARITEMVKANLAEHRSRA